MFGFDPVARGAEAILSRAEKRVQEALETFEKAIEAAEIEYVKHSEAQSALSMQISEHQARRTTLEALAASARARAKALR